MTPRDVAAWEGFAVALAGVCAVLAGLVFLAVSINIERILRVRGLAGRAGESVILFLSAVCLCAFVLIPHQPVAALGAELLGVGLVTLAILTVIVLSALRIPTRQPRSWTITRVVIQQAAAVPVILAGCSLLGWIAGGLYWLAAGVLCAVIAATGNAWVLLVEVVRDERYAPIDGPAGADVAGTERRRPA
jgi:modulator of FtsH protease